MARVTGIGGFFLRAREPEALNAWSTDSAGPTRAVDLQPGARGAAPRGRGAPPDRGAPVGVSGLGERRVPARNPSGSAARRARS